MSGFFVNLPKSLDLDLNGLSIQAIEKRDTQFYTDIYSDMKLMHYINDEINFNEIRENFTSLIDEINQPIPKYISYIIKLKSDKLGIFGLKLLSPDELELGMILQRVYQHHGWSKKIKQAFIPYAFKTLKIKQVIAYCKHDNGAENHVNQALGFKLEKQFIHKRKNHLMNKWVLTQSKQF